VKEQVFDVGHLAAVKNKLRALLTSEITPLQEMSHTGEQQQLTTEMEGTSFLRLNTLQALTFISMPQVQCNVGDWVEVTCDYSPGVCSGGGTGVVIAKSSGTVSPPNIISSNILTLPHIMNKRTSHSQVYLWTSHCF
jgi:hypothetical protein